MSDKPLDLRSLADVDSPDVVRAALKTFRRRVIVSSLWALLAGLIAVAIAYTFLQPRSLPDRIRSASPVAHPVGAIWDVARERIALVDVARLGDHVGLHFVMVPSADSAESDPDPTPGGIINNLTPSGLISLDAEGSFDWWMEVRSPDDGTITMDVFHAGRCAKVAECMGSFEVDLAALGVPEEVWR